MDTPAVFIGSSTQGLDFARAARGLLAADAEITIWNEGFFEIGSTFIESLVNNVERFDFAILVMTPDDLRVKNGHEELQPRDNVIFELGLFMGRLGRARTFVLQQRHADLRLPSDLSGVTTALYDWPRDDKSHKSAVGPASDTIRDAMRQLGLSERKTQQQIREVAKEQKEQKSIIDEHQAFFDIVKYSISSFCYVALWHIENNLEYIYRHNDEYFRRRMWFLADSGYIEPREPNSFLTFDQNLDGRDLCKAAKLTPVGRYLVALRGSP